MHERFHYKTKEDLLRTAASLGLDLPYSDDISPLLQPALLEGRAIQNRIVVQPMEGYDSENDGSPSGLTLRRYRRYAEGGNGMIWLEAVSVVQDGRSNPAQLWINEKNISNFSRLSDEIRMSAASRGFNPFLVVQLTHSGRYSQPCGRSEPRVASSNPLLDNTPPYVLSDDELMKVRDEFVKASGLAFRAGFDAVDLKACHGYLLIDILSAKKRKNSVFGGEDPLNRFRFLLETISIIKNEVPGLIVTTRLNVSDLYKGGFGVDENGETDFTEPMALTGELINRGVRLLNISMGSPYFNPHVSRPYDTPLPGRKPPGEHPLKGVMRMIGSTALFQKRFPEVQAVGSAYSYLRHFAPNVGAGVLSSGGASFIGFGRNSFAYPAMPLDLISTGKADPSKTCITCSGCTRLIRNLSPGGCVIRDREIYGKELKKLIADGK